MSPQPLCPSCRAPCPRMPRWRLCPRCLLDGVLAGDGDGDGDATVDNLEAIAPGPGAQDPEEPEERVRSTDGAEPRTDVDPDATRACLPGIPAASTDAGKPRSGLEGERTPAIPGYEIGKMLGRGGMGVVYKATQVALKRPVALKMIRADSDVEPAQLERFRVEAEAVARLRHPNVVQIYEVGEADGMPYFSLELVEGGTLAERLAGAPIARRPAAELAVTLARAMGAVHRVGIVHRDLKPANVLFDTRRDAQDHRLRPGQAARGRGRPDDDRPGDGDAQLHGPRAGPGADRPDRPAGRHLRPRGDPLRDAHRPAAVQGAEHGGDAGAGRLPGAGAAVAAPAAGAARPGDDLPEVPRQGAGAALRDGRRAGRRPGAVPGRRPDPRPADARLGAGRQVGAAAAGGRRAGRGRPGPGDRAGRGRRAVPGLHAPPRKTRLARLRLEAVR